jgi:arginine repressor
MPFKKISIITIRYCLTQRQMKIKMQENNLNCSQSTISRLLRKAELTRKRVKLRPAHTQNLAHLETRKAFARKIRVLSDDIIIYLEETGFNLHLGSKYGYSPKNSDAYRLVFYKIESEMLACLHKQQEFFF